MNVRQSLRFLRKNPAFSAIAITALALGIGANAAIFTVINTVLLKPLPYPEPDKIVRVMRGFRGGEGDSVSVPKYVAWKRFNQVFESITAYDSAGPGMNLAGGDKPDVIKGIHVSAEFFKVFRAQPAIGRFFSPEEDKPGGPQLAVISYGLWRKSFGGDPGIVGRAIKLNDDLFTVTGVMPLDFVSYPPADVWLPLQPDPNSTNHGNYLRVAGRLKPGVTLEAANAQLKIVAEETRREHPKWMNKEETVRAVDFQREMSGDIRRALLILVGAVGFVLLIASANVANLLLARAAGRQREIAVRIAIGASRGQLIRQLLTESTILSLCGGALGLLIGVWGVRALISVIPGELPRAAEFTSLDPRIVLFTVAVCLLTAVLFGLFPALQISRPHLASTLKESSSRSGTSLRHNRSRALLVVTETALAVVLLIGAALLIRSFASLRNTNPGFNTKNLLTMQISLAGAKYAKTAAVERLFEQTIQRVESLPGIAGASAAIALPLESEIDLPFTVEGRPAPESGFHGSEQWRSIGAHYFSVLGVAIRRGRAFDERDTGRSSPVLIINEAFAKRYFSKDDPIGQRITIGRGLGPQFEEATRQIVGVAADIREQSLDSPPPPVMYVPTGQATDGLTTLANAVIPRCLIARTGPQPHSFASAIERELQGVDGQLALTRVRTMEDVLADVTARQNFNMLLLGIFSAIALFLAAIGIYGLMSYSVEQRTQEIGIRMALGAGQGRMVGMIVRQGAQLAIAGVAIGLVAAYGLTRVMTSLLYEVKATDPLAFAGVAILLTLVALAATYLPARRATKVDPVCALRYE